MNNSWKTSSQTSPGFVYFNNAQTTPQKTDTSDFMSFSDQQSPTKNYFSPRNYSSPQHHKQQQRGSPRGYNNYQGRFQQKRYSGQNQSFSPNKTYNSSFNHSNSSSSSFGKQNISKAEKSFNKNAYLHPSFTEDPWSELERQLKIRMDEVKRSNDGACSDGSESGSNDRPAT